MSEQTLLASAAFSAVAAIVYAYVGLRLGQRPVSADAKLASKAFALWWFSLAGITAFGGAQSAVAALAGPPSLPVFLGLTYAVLLVLCAALWGLLYYLVYLFTGERRLWAPLAVLYAAIAVFLFWYIWASQPTDVLVGRWSVTLQYAAQVTGPAQAVLAATILLPQILGALAYGTLYFKVTDHTRRYRIAVVSVSIILWFGASAVASATGLSQNDSWQLASRGIGLAAAFAILFAYQPPGPLRRKYGLRSITEETAEARGEHGAAPGPRQGSVPSAARRTWARPRPG